MHWWAHQAVKEEGRGISDLPGDVLGLGSAGSP